MNDFLAGDQVIGKGYDNWNRVGKISESVITIKRSFIFVDWEDGVTRMEKKASLRRLVPPTAAPTANIEVVEARESEPDIENAILEPLIDEMVVDEPLESSGDEESGSDSSSSDEQPDGDGGDVAQDIDDQVPQHVPLQPPFDKEGPGIDNSGGRGQGRGAGRGRGGREGERGGRGRYVSPPLPSSLHAFLDRGSATRPATFQQWTEEPIAVDPSVEYPSYIGGMRLKWNEGGVFPPELDIPPIQEREFIHYFKLMFPLQYLHVILESTNNALHEDSRYHDPVTRQELFVYFAIRIATALRPIDGPISEYWDIDVPEDDNIFEAFDFGNKFGMNYERFKVLTRCLRLAEYDRFQLSNDPYICIDGFIEAFNERRRAIVVPGSNIVVDECMSSWKGEEILLSHESVMHSSKIARKPKGVGVEFKSCADGESNVLLALEIQKGAVHNAQRQYADRYPFHVAVVLRLINNWFGTGRRIIADAAFTSLLTCTVLLSYGMFFIGILKNATKGYPVQYCKQFEESAPERGTWKSISTIVEVGGHPRKVISALWCSKKHQVKKIIGTCSTTLPGTPVVVKRSKRVFREVNWEERGDDEGAQMMAGDVAGAKGIWVTERERRLTNRPKIVEDLFAEFGATDLHDRYRQGFLKLEAVWKTNTMWQRLFATILGMIVTDAYLAWIYEIKKSGNPDINVVPFRTACRRLVKQMTKCFQVSVHRRGHHTVPIAPALELPSVGHLPDLERRCCSNPQCFYTQGKGTNCPSRKRRYMISTYCTACSDVATKRYAMFCSNIKRDCFTKHLHTEHAAVSMIP